MKLPFVCASGSGPTPNFEGRIAELVRNSEYRGEDPSKVRRDLKLYSRCSGQFVQMYSRVINARGKLHSPFGEPQKKFQSSLTPLHKSFNCVWGTTLVFVGKIQLLLEGLCKRIKEILRLRSISFSISSTQVSRLCDSGPHFPLMFQ